MRWTNILICFVVLTFAFAGAGVPLRAADLGGRATGITRTKVKRSDEMQTEEKVAEFCFVQRQICRKICSIHSNFNDRFDGCPQSCETREDPLQQYRLLPMDGARFPDRREVRRI